MLDSANCILTAITISRMKRVTLAATTATSTDAGDEKDQADGSLLSGFRSGQPIRIGSKGATFSRSQEIGSIKAD